LKDWEKNKEQQHVTMKFVTTGKIPMQIGKLAKTINNETIDLHRSKRKDLRVLTFDF
jgi:hypothetical protein